MKCEWSSLSFLSNVLRHRSVCNITMVTDVSGQIWSIVRQVRTGVVWLMNTSPRPIVCPSCNHTTLASVRTFFCFHAFIHSLQSSHLRIRRDRALTKFLLFLISLSEEKNYSVRISMWLVFESYWSSTFICPMRIRGLTYIKMDDRSALQASPLHIGDAKWSAILSFGARGCAVVTGQQLAAFSLTLRSGFEMCCSKLALCCLS